jgi:hypothetical protein
MRYITKVKKNLKDDISSSDEKGLGKDSSNTL